MIRTHLFLFLFISTSIFGQTRYDQYDRLISDAINATNLSNYKESLSSYENAFKLIARENVTNYFNAAVCAIKLNQIDRAEDLISRGISSGGGTIEYLNSFKGFDNNRQDLFFKNVIINYNKLRQKYFAEMENIDAYLKVKEIFNRDQFARKLEFYASGISERDREIQALEYMDAFKNNDTFTIKSHQLKSKLRNKDYENFQHKVILSVDSLNIEELKEITLKNGWQDNGWIILWHQRGTYGDKTDFWDYFKPLINNEIEEGLISRKFWIPFDNYISRN